MKLKYNNISKLKQKYNTVQDICIAPYNGYTVPITKRARLTTFRHETITLGQYWHERERSRK